MFDLFKVVLILFKIYSGSGWVLRILNNKDIVISDFLLFENSLRFLIFLLGGIVLILIFDFKIFLGFEKNNLVFLFLNIVVKILLNLVLILWIILVNFVIIILFIWVIVDFKICFVCVNFFLFFINLLYFFFFLINCFNVFRLILFSLLIFFFIFLIILVVWL